MDYKDESGILTIAGEKPKIMAAIDNNIEVYRIHWNPFCRGTYYMSSKTLPFNQIDLRTDDIDEAKRRAERRYNEYKNAA